MNNPHQRESLSVTRTNMEDFIINFFIILMIMIIAFAFMLLQVYEHGNTFKSETQPHPNILMSPVQKYILI